jgi:tetratricopeptide (TPR) repeat protein
MGVVYRARQRQLNREVALKMILQGGHAGRDERLRFLAEAEAIAAVRHPGIVQVHDFGTHNDLPYFALELCPGGSLADRLSGTPLPPPEAARLVEQVARAVQAAHDRGIVHRDLKPGNVLLGEDGAARVTDFGLAKRVEGGSGLTATGAVMGTPSYMAPEQAQGKKDVGRPADVYALGAVLYECLTGRPPFKAATTFDTLLQVVGDQPVPPRQLNPQVPPDLETVCLKCLRKEPASRYATAAELADDLRSFQAGEPVRARPVARWEQLWRWCRRAPVVAGLSAALLLAVVGGLAGLTLLWWHADSQRADAVAAREQSHEMALEARRQKTAAETQARRARDEADRAGREAGRANQTARFLTDMFTAADPLGLGGLPSLKSRGGEALSARDILDRGAARVSEDLSQEPQTQAQLLNTIGHVYCVLGLPDQAKPLLEKALAIRRGALPGDHPDLAATLHNLGWLQQQEGDYAAAGRFYREALVIRQKRADSDPVALSATMFNLGWLLADEYDLPGSEKMFRACVDLRVRHLGARHRDVAIARLGLAATYISGNKMASAVTPYFQAMAALREAEGGKGLAESVNLFMMGMIMREPLARSLLGAGEGAGPEDCLRRSLRLAKQVLGERHPYAALVLHELGVQYQLDGKDEDAERCYRESLSIVRGYGLHHPKATFPLTSLCRLLHRRGSQAEAATLLPLGGAAGRLLLPRLLLSGQAKQAEAEKLLEEALQARRQRLPQGHFGIADILVLQAEQLAGYGASPRLRQLFRDALDIYCRVPGPPRGYVSLRLSRLSGCLDGQGCCDLACALARAAAGLPGDEANRQGYPDLAVDLLRRARARGLNDPKRLLQDKDLDGLRGRDDFKRLAGEATRALER